MNTHWGGMCISRYNSRHGHAGVLSLALASLACSSPDDSTLLLPTQEETPCLNTLVEPCSTGHEPEALNDATFLDANDGGPESSPPPSETTELTYNIVTAAPADGSLNFASSAELLIELEDLPAPATALFYGRKVENEVGKDFTFVVLPDTQHYVETPTNYKTFVKQVEWILREKVERNIRLVDHLGDIVQHPLNPEEWQRAGEALLLLNQDDFAVGIAPGNHDLRSFNARQSLYDEYLPAFTSEDNINESYDAHPWYGGYLGGRNDRITADDLSYENREWKDNYVLFSAGGMDFINIAIEYDFPGDTEQWLDNVLTAYPNRRAILSTHEFLGADGEFVNQQYQRIWSKVLTKHCSVFLVLSAHVPGEARKQEARGERNPACPESPVYFLTSNYQERDAGGDGWLRILTFHPADDGIEVQTYSPTRSNGEYETDYDSEFSIYYDMKSQPQDWRLLEGRSAIRGGLISAVWSNLENNTEYEWYVQFTDSQGIDKNSTRYRFKTQMEESLFAPSSVNATSSSPERIDLEWVDNSSSEMGYVILQGSPGELAEVAKIAANRTSYSVIGLQADTKYCFEIFARGTEETRSPHASSCATTLIQSD